VNPRSNLQRQIRAVRDGRGQGRGTEYTAFIQIRRNDFASQGRSHYWPSLIMERNHDLLSDLERAALLRVQLLSPLDVREQYPLRLEGVEEEFESEHPDARGTMEIAEALGIRHPRVSASDALIMTTDLLVDASAEKRFAVYVKYTKDLVNSRKKELRAIEAAYWYDRGTRMGVFTERDANKVEIGNLLMFASTNLVGQDLVPSAFLHRVVAKANHRPMKEALSEIAAEDGLAYGTVVDKVKWACGTGNLCMDLTRKRLLWGDVWPTLHVTGAGLAVDADHTETEIDLEVYG
jgi:hypothetical protein